MLLPRRVECLWVTWLTHTCDMTHSFFWHDTFIFVTYPCSDMWYDHVWHDSLIYVTRLIHFLWHDVFISAMCPCLDVWHDHVWRDSLICVTPLINLRDMTLLYLWHVTWCVVWLCVTWLTHTCDMTHYNLCDMTHLYFWHVSNINASCRTSEWVMSHVWVSHVTHGHTTNQI